MKCAMSRDLKTFSLWLCALGAAACSSAYAVHSGSEGEPLAAISQPMARSPYDVELIGEDGRALATYEKGDRFYVLGLAGDRYSIRVTNPTARRIEALISVDGLDVIDGEAADFVKKRGYVVPPGGELVVDGFRMSTTQVAAFRFSSVGESYAELKGKGRNVGVIGVAVFEEKEQPQMIVPQAGATQDPAARDRRSGAEGEADERAESSGSAGKSSGGAPAAAAADAPGDVAATEPSPSSPPAEQRRFEDKDSGGEVCCGPARKKSRPGLGTQWGEERYSAVDFTSFERASASVPTAMAELRYNDSEGLRALGIQLQPAPDAVEVEQRETAEPFPAARGFATPPQ